MKTLRTPDECFENLSGFPYAPHYTEVPDGDGGHLRMHHLDEGPSDGPVVLCMHGQPTWSYLYRHMIPLLNASGLRVLAPDLVGYGRSDKPASREDYSYQAQVDWMNAWLVANDVKEATFFGQDWGGLIGLRTVAENPDRFDRVVISNTGLPLPQATPDEVVEKVRRFRAEAPTPSLPEVFAALSNPEGRPFAEVFAYWQKWCWESEDLPVGMSVAGTIDGRTPSAEEVAAYDAPFPDPSYKMGTRAMPSQVPTLPDDPSVEANRRAWEVFKKWEKPFLTAFTNNDPVSGGGEQPFQLQVPGAVGQPHQIIEGGGHFVQEGRAEAISEIIRQFVKPG
ncbi:MAG: haloalkane dehalogenase [Myxococcota bacterium]|nr:haloalkane dehalogenase [Myxococcota bacterium]